MSGIPSLVTDLPGPREAGTAFAYLDPCDYPAWSEALDALTADYDNAASQARTSALALWATTQGQFANLLNDLEARYAR